MICPHCRATLADGSRFCSNCGRPTNVEAAREASRADPAAGLSTPQGGGAERIPGGSPRTEWPANDVASSSPDESERRSRTVLFLLALLLGLLVGGSALWLLTRSRGAPGSVATV